MNAAENPKEGRSNEETEPSECMIDEVRMVETELSLVSFAQRTKSEVVRIDF